MGDRDGVLGFISGGMQVINIQTRRNGLSSGNAGKDWCGRVYGVLDFMSDGLLMVRCIKIHKVFGLVCLCRQKTNFVVSI